MIKYLRSAVCLFLLAEFSAVAQITNGSFEVPAVATFINLTNSDTRLIGWTVTNAGGPVAVNNSLQAFGSTPDGTNTIIFNGGNGAVGSSIRQDFPTLVGERYVVSFNVGNTGSGSAEMAATASISSSAGTLLHSVRAIAPLGIQGTNRTYFFTATTPITTIQFLDSSTSSIAADLSLDNVSVVRAPLIINGSFEVPTTSTFIALTNNDSRLVGWTVVNTGGAVSVISSIPNTGDAAPDGINGLSFNGANSPVGSSIWQNFATIIGETYVVTYNFGKVGTSGAEIAVTASLKSNAGDLLKSLRTIPATGSHWNSTSIFFTASTSITKLEFLDSSTSSTAADLILDNVAVLSVPPSQAGDCTLPPAGLVSWWRGDGSALDFAGTNHGILLGNTTYAAGKVGQAFVFDGNGDGIRIGNPTNLQLQTFTIEAWVKRSSTTQISGNSPWGELVGYGENGYVLGFFQDGRLFLSKNAVNAVESTGAITDLGWHHVAVTKSGSAVTFYIDGATNTTTSYNETFSFSTDLTIGAVNNTVDSSFLGSIDELSIYNRPLSSSELQAVYQAGIVGKCTAAPTIVQQPQGQTKLVGDNATFNVLAIGTPTLTYQWRFNGSNILNATSSSLTITNLQLSDSGTYSVVVSNSESSVTSSNAVLTVNLPPTCAPPPAALQNWWPANGNTNDVVSGKNASLVNGTTFAAGKVGQAFSFDGINDSISFGTAVGNFGTNNFTVEFWLKTTSTRQEAIVSKRPVCGNSSFFSVRLDNFRIAVEMEGDSSGANSNNHRGNKVVNDGVFHHVAITRQGTNVTLYVDGVLDMINTTPGITSISNSTAFLAGRDSCVGVDGTSYFKGLLDELSIYGRALSVAEIQGIYNAAYVGKCDSLPPYITQQPASQNKIVGEQATLSVAALGTQPLIYQWFFNGTNIIGATNFSLVLSNLQLTDSGNYGVIVSNISGSVSSSNATLTVNVAPPCFAAPQGLVSWWRGDGNALDFAGTNHGTLLGNATYAAGKVGQTFAFDGNGDGIRIGNPTNLQLQTLTIEAWVKRSSLTQVSGSSSNGELIGYGVNGYVLGFFQDGRLFLSKNGVNSVQSTGAITDLAWHHVAVTKSGSAVTFYIDGAIITTATYSVTFSFSTDLTIGAVNNTVDSSFLGSIDELSIYNRALTSNELQSVYQAGGAGKCIAAPNIVQQPANLAKLVGESGTFSVGVVGSNPLNFQWLFQGTNIVGATNSSLILTNLQLSQAGNYSVTVSNAFSVTNSSNALLTVNFPPATLRVQSSTNMAGSVFAAPILLLANGNENAVGFSLTFSTQFLSFVSVDLGANASGASVLLNTNDLALGRVGVALALPAGQTFSAGTREVIRVNFISPVLGSTVATTIAFGDIPTVRQVSDVAAQILTATYASGTVTLLPSDLEADTAPRPNGNRAVTITDWVQVGRFVARLDTPAEGSEFQRADCAPRATFGDGEMKVTDWVQAGRYAAGLDALAVAGGPTNETAARPSSKKTTADPASGRELQVVNVTGDLGVPVNVPILLQSLGDETALTFSIAFEPAKFVYQQTTLGSAASGMSLILNTNDIALGRVGITLGISAGTAFTTGLREIIVITLTPTAGGSSSVSLGNQPVPKGISDANATELNSGYFGGLVTVNPLPTLSISNQGSNVIVWWPTSAAGFVLQSTANPLAAWTNNLATPETNGSGIRLTLPATDNARFYRLKK